MTSSELHPWKLIDPLHLQALELIAAWTLRGTDLSLIYFLSKSVFSSNTATKSRRKPPLSSVLDDGQIGSPTPINEHARVSHQFTARGPDGTPHRQHHHLFDGSPPPRTPGYELNVSLEDPFERREDSHFGANASSIADFRNQFGSPSLSRSRGFGATNTMAMSLGQPFDATGGSFAGATERQVSLPCTFFYPFIDNSIRRVAGIIGLWCLAITMGTVMLMQPYCRGFKSTVPSLDIRLVRALATGFSSGFVPDFFFDSSNCTALDSRYESPTMADRAVCENGTFFNATTVISVSRLNPTIAKYMNLHLSRDGETLTQEGVDLSVVYNAADVQQASEKAALIQRRTGTRRNNIRGKYEEESTHSSINSSVNSSSNSSGSSVSGEEELDSSIYLKPNRTKSICTKIVEYFFSY